MARLDLIALDGIPLVRPGDDLASVVLEGLARSGLALRQGDILVLAQKIVSKAEGRLVDLASVEPSARAVEIGEQVSKDPRFVELVLQESRQVLRARPDVLIVEHRLGLVMANAGIDRSNVAAGERDLALLLPEDPDATAARLRAALLAATGAEIGVVVNDSFGRAWRKGTTGVAIGAAGLPALLDRRGHPDLFGRPLQVTMIGLADEIASAASLLMGQGDEGRPVVLMRGLDVSVAPGTAQDLIRPEAEDLFR
jgi:coenzyme F420-0:L-glutamate ligase/coenzyme F420-1:gamma-L-glutamate ligase